MKLFAAFRRHDEKAKADTLYRLIVAQSRLPIFYEELGVPDTPDGRYDVLMAHVVLVLRRLNRGRSRTRELAQALFDLMFADMDQNLREMGVGDLAVGKRVKGMAKAFYGRLAAYDAALGRGDAAALKSALIRNLFRKTMPTDAQVAAVAAYLQREAARLDLEPLQSLTSGQLSFGIASIAGLEDPK